jgi:hypothetical protein
MFDDALCYPDCSSTAAIDGNRFCSSLQPVQMGRSDRQRHYSGSSVGADQLALGREAYEARAWDDAYRFLMRAGEEAALSTDELERLAMSAYLTGRDEEYLRALERTHSSGSAARGRMQSTKRGRRRTVRRLGKWRKR